MASRLLCPSGSAHTRGRAIGLYHGWECLSERRGGQLCIRLLPDGKPLAEFVHRDNGTKVTFVSERSFGAGGSYRSISFPQRPDIVLEVEREDTSHLIIFDPKYKLDSEDQEVDEVTGRPKKIDIDKMHAYRDAIRDAAGRQVVSHASILYPGSTVAFGDRIAALRAVPGEVATTEVIDSMLSAALTEPV